MFLYDYHVNTTRPIWLTILQDFIETNGSTLVFIFNISCYGQAQTPKAIRYTN